MKNIFFLFVLAILIAFSAKSQTIENLASQYSYAAGGRAWTIEKLKSNDNNLVLVSDCGGIYTSNNQGESWTGFHPGGLFEFNDAIFFGNNSNNIIAATDAVNHFHALFVSGIYRTTDGGHSWIKCDLPNEVRDYDINFEVKSLYEDNSGKLWAGTSFGLIKSINGGSNWQYVILPNNYHGEISSVKFSEVNENIGAALAIDRIFYTKNAGITWYESQFPGTINKCGDEFLTNSMAITDGDIFIAMDMKFNYDQSYQNVCDSGFIEGKSSIVKFNCDKHTWDVSFVKSITSWPSFIRMQSYKINVGQNNEEQKFDLYYCDGFSDIYKTTLPDQNLSDLLSNSIRITRQHADVHDILVLGNGTPKFLLDDGGIEIFDRSSNAFTLFGSGKNGYQSLLINDVSGHYGSLDYSELDLYITMQDNGRSSSCNGFSRNLAGDNFYGRIFRPYCDPEFTRFFGNALGRPWISSICFDKNIDFDVNTFNHSDRNKFKCWDWNSMILIKPKEYVFIGNYQEENNKTCYKFYKSVDDCQSWELFKTENLGGDTCDFLYRNWQTAQYKNLNKNSKIEIHGITILRKHNKNIFYDSGNLISSNSFENGSQNLNAHLVDLSNLHGQNSNNQNYSVALFSYPTGAVGDFHSFSVSPQNSSKRIFVNVFETTKNILITNSNPLRLTTDPEFIEMNSLENAVMNEHLNLFDGNDCEVISFGFDPECDNHILAGTRHVGIFETFDDGATWNKIPGTESFPYISSFFFAVDKSVVFSSFGMGLGKIGNNRNGRLVADLTPCDDENKIFVPGQGLKSIIH